MLSELQPTAFFPSFKMHSPCCIVLIFLLARGNARLDFEHAFDQWYSDQGFIVMRILSRRNPPSKQDLVVQTCDCGFFFKYEARASAKSRLASRAAHAAQRFVKLANYTQHRPSDDASILATRFWKRQ